MSHNFAQQLSICLPRLKHIGYLAMKIYFQLAPLSSESYVKLDEDNKGTFLQTEEKISTYSMVFVIEELKNILNQVHLHHGGSLLPLEFFLYVFPLLKTVKNLESLTSEMQKLIFSILVSQIDKSRRKGHWFLFSNANGHFSQLPFPQCLDLTCQFTLVD